MSKLTPEQKIIEIIKSHSEDTYAYDVENNEVSEDGYKCLNEHKFQIVAKAILTQQKES